MLSLGFILGFDCSVDPSVSPEEIVAPSLGQATPVPGLRFTTPLSVEQSVIPVACVGGFFRTPPPLFFVFAGIAAASVLAFDASPASTPLVPARMNHSFLRNVTSESQKWTIRVRVTRFSEYKNKEEPPQIVRLDLILLDEEGKAMEAQIPQRWLPKFMPQLKEGSIYYIQDFQVCDARGQYRPVDHPFMVRFTSYTRIIEVNRVLDTFPKYAYSLATYEELRSRIGNNEYCSNTIGVFIGCTHVKVQNTKTGPKKLRNIYLTDGREPAVVALWNEHADSFNAEHYMQMAIQGPVVFLFVAVTCGEFQGKLSLQGSASCKWYANPEIAEAVALQDSCAGRISAPTWHGPAAAQLSPQRITIAELAKFDNPHDIYANRYIIKTKIKSLVTDQSWCAAPRYRLPIIVTDPIPLQSQQQEPTVELVFFGTIAQEIVGVPVDSLIASEGGTGAFLPTRITSLYGRQFELCISPSQGSLQRTNITYQVDKIVGTASVPLPLPAAAEPPSLQQQQTSTQQQSTSASSDLHLATTGAAKDINSPLIHSSIISSPNPTPKMPTTLETAIVETPQMQHTPPVPE
ncbi:unnamed protein product [Urochloa decumbens]|uniref:Replication protein A 70 kDa DNA-binding subunit B/D first OB fold domain-containing protein n=1 Tax=Urochloa decumbens TaxID=240449 RepID=A0ABC9E4B5_9POAL